MFLIVDVKSLLFPLSYYEHVFKNNGNVPTLMGCL